MEIEPQKQSDHSTSSKHENKSLSTTSEVSGSSLSFVSDIYRFIYQKFKMIYDFMIYKVKNSDNLLTEKLPEDQQIEILPEDQQIEILPEEQQIETLDNNSLLEELNSKQKNILILELKRSIYDKFGSSRENLDDIDDLANKFFALFKTDITVDRINEELKSLLNQSSSIEDFDNLLNELPCAQILGNIFYSLGLQRFKVHLVQISWDLLKNPLEIDMNKYLNSRFSVLQNDEPIVSEALLNFIQRVVKHHGFLEVLCNEQSAKDFSSSIEDGYTTIKQFLENCNTKMIKKEEEVEEQLKMLNDEMEKQEDDMTVSGFFKKNIYFLIFLNNVADQIRFYLCKKANVRLHFKDCLAIASIIPYIDENKVMSISSFNHVMLQIDTLLTKYAEFSAFGNQNFFDFIEFELKKLSDNRPDLCIKDINSLSTYESYIIHLFFIKNFPIKSIANVMEKRLDLLSTYDNYTLIEFLKVRVPESVSS